jgi:hypothetical protein
VIETVNSTLKRAMPSPIKKKLAVRKATEIAASLQPKAAYLSEVYKGHRSVNEVAVHR